MNSQTKNNMISLLIDAIPIPIFIKNNYQQYINCNKSFESFFSLIKKDIIQKTVFDISPLEYANIHWAKDIELLNNANLNNQKSVVYSLQSNQYNETIYKSLLKDENGKVTGIIGAIIDNSEKTLIEQALVTSIERYSQIIETCNEGVWLMDADNVITFANKKLSEITGYSIDEIVEKTVDTFIQPNSSNFFSNMFEKLIKIGEEKKVITILTREGGRSPFYISISPITNETGKHLGSLCLLSEYKENTNNEKNVKSISSLLEAVMNSFPDIISILDKDCNILYLNKSGCDFFNISENAFIGMKCYEILDNSKYPPLCRRKEVFAKKETAYIEHHDPETDTWIDIRYYPVLDSDGNVDKIIEHRRDITHQKHTERTLIESLKTEKEINILKAEFISNFSHETRTPLNGIMGYAQLLLSDKNLDAEKRDYVNNILKSGDRLLALLDNILDISQIEQGSLKIQYSLFNIDNMIEDILFLNKYRIEEREVQISFTNNSIQDIYSDARRIHIILTNLIGNAIKFTKKGVISITLENLNGNYLFSIKDSGIGIAPHLVSRIFQDFTKGELGYIREYEGIGLGLSICKKLVTLLGGKIWFETLVDSGSTFYFNIPETINEAKEKTQDVFETKCIPTDENNVRILVVDDDITSLYYYKTILETRKNYIFKLFSSPTEFLNELRHITDYHIIILDIRMAKLHGFELLKKIKKMAPDIPVIAITAFAESFGKQHFYEMGFSELLIKPVTSDILLYNIDRFVKKN